MLSLRIALRYLFSRKSHSAVNIISLISLAGVAVATTALVCVLSVFNGFKGVAESRLSHIDPELKVERRDGRMIVGADSLARRIAGVEGVALALPTLTGQALAVTSGRQMPVTLKGVADGYDRLTAIGSLVVDGEYIDSAGADSLAALYGPGSQRRLCAALSVGVAGGLSSPTGITDLVALYVPRRVGAINPANPLGAFAADSVVASAVFEVDQPEYDADLVVMPIEGVRGLLEYDRAEATAIELAATEGTDVAALKRQLERQLGPDFAVKDRLEQMSQAMRMIAVEKWISLLLLAFILIIASFNIISTLSILIIEKTDSIATLSALGATPRFVRRIFTGEGWLISAAGGVVGIVVGVALCLAQQHWGFIKFAADTSHLSISAYPVRVEAVDLLIALALVALTGLLSTAATRRFVASRV